MGLTTYISALFGRRTHEIDDIYESFRNLPDGKTIDDYLAEASNSLEQAETIIEKRPNKDGIYRAVMHLKEAATNTAIPVKHISDMLDDLRLLSGFNDAYNGRRKIWRKAVREYLMIRKAEEIYRKLTKNDKLDKSLSEASKINLNIWDKKPPTNTQFPDIYYIILDRYAADKSLKEEFEYDNSGFTGYLKSKGFFVCQNCWANYYSSAHSIASSLNMVYLDDLISPQHQTDRDWKKIYGLIKNHQVGKILKLIGYKYYHLGSWWWPTSKNKMADHNINLGLFSEFSSNLFSNTVFYPFVRKFNLPIFDGRYAQWRRINYQMGKLADIPDISSATFVFAHFIIPHEPYIFEANGNYLTSDKEAKRSAREKYTEQIIFLNSRLHSLIDGILLKEKNSVIILQADEGPYPSAFENNKNQYDWALATPAEISLKMSILSAFYFPQDKYTDLEDKTLSPVNTFRIIFNKFLNGRLALLENRYFLGNMTYPYNMLEVKK